MVRRLDYLWRLLITGAAFLSFSLFGFLMTVTLFPLVSRLSRTNEERVNRIRWLIHKAFQLLIASLLFFKVIDFGFKGAERLSGERGRLVVANHPTLIDVVLMLSIMPQAQCMVKHNLWSHRFLGGVVRAAGYIRNDGDPETILEACRAAIQQGHDIIVFPEGTRTVPGKPIKFQRGFANIAAIVPCNIQVVTVTCSQETLTKGSSWYEIPKQRPRFYISVGEELDVKTYLAREPRAKVVRRLTRELEDYYNRKLYHG